jgi:putative peptidoglycan lipid II flippase
MSLAVAFTIVGSATLLSRVTGFLRDVLIAALLGTSAVAEAYVAAFLIPNLVRRMMSEGGLHAAIIPPLARLEQEGGRESARAFAAELLTLLSGVAILVVVLAEIFMPQIMRILAHGFTQSPEKLADAITFGRIAFPFVGFTLVLALYGAMLNTVERFAAAALVPVILNLLLIGVLIALLSWPGLSLRDSGLALVITILVAGLVQLVLLAWAVGRVGFEPLPRFGFLPRLKGQEAPSVLLMALPGMLIAGSGHIHMVLASQFSSVTPHGLASLYFADRLFQLPLGFAASAMGVVLLPRIASAWQAGDEQSLRDARAESLRFAAMLILPAATALYLLASPIVTVLFQRDAFTASDSAATTENLRWLALSLPAFVLAKILLPEFLARERMRLPLFAALCAFAVNILTVLSAPFSSFNLAPVSGVVSGAWTYALLLFAMGWRRFGITSSALYGVVMAGVGCGVMGLVVVYLKEALRDWLQPPLFFHQKGLALAILCFSGLVVYAAVLVGSRALAWPERRK